MNDNSLPADMNKYLFSDGMTLDDFWICQTPYGETIHFKDRITGKEMTLMLEDEKLHISIINHLKELGVYIEKHETQYFERDITRDIEDLIQKTVTLTSRGNHPAAITLLEKALRKFPAESQLYYLLGAEYTQIGEYENAIGAMTQAITLNPELNIAVFQLGLLYLTQRQAVEAAKTWAPLADLPENDSLRLFSLGLQHLAKNEFTQCQILLEEGIKNNYHNPTLNTDMQKVLGNIKVIG